jgi:hypothetical protein
MNMVFVWNSSLQVLSLRVREPKRWTRPVDEIVTTD